MNLEKKVSRRSALAVAGAPLVQNLAAQSRRPNILILHCHDLGQHLHCYGVQGVESPHLDRFAAQGVLFERSFCTAPQCSPSRASIFTGRYPHSHGVMGLTHADFAWDFHPDERHLGQILSDGGYATAGVGILHETRSGPKRCGLADYINAAEARPVADATIAALRRLVANPDKPFYLQAGCLEPHRLTRGSAADADFLGGRLQPDTARGVSIPPYLRDTEGTRRELAELQGSIRHMDEQMGRILSAVTELGLEQNTLVVFTTDHGIAMPRAKCSLYEPGLQTSLILRYGGRPGWRGGKRKHELISNVDYLPTILDAAGLPVPGNLQGRSFAPLLDGGSYPERDRIFGEITYHDYYDPRRSVRTEGHKLIVNFSSAPAFMDPSQSWRPRSDTVAPPNHALAYHPPFELYDLQTDPWERRDVSADRAYAAVLQELRASLRTHMQSTGDPILNGAVTSPLHRRSQSWLLGS